MVKYLQEAYEVSERRSCKVLRINRTAAVRVRYGYKRIHILLKREGWNINHKRVYRLYKEEGLNLRNKSKRKQISAPRVPDKNMPLTVNECWEIDFVSDQLYDGKRFRALIIIDTYSRECLAIYVDKSIKSEAVADTLSENGSLRDECLNVNWFMSLADARKKIENWRKDYNEFGPHSGLTNMIPSEFASALINKAI